MIYENNNKKNKSNKSNNNKSNKTIKQLNGNFIPCQSVIPV